MIKTDVLVIGAGPAGSTAARFAAKGGAVLLKDVQKVFPKEPLKS